MSRTDKTRGPRKFHVYVDWTREKNPRPFYVGKGLLKRVGLSVRNKHHSHVSAKHGFDRRIILETFEEQEAFEEEIRLIKELATCVYDSNYNGIGCNYTWGGDGAQYEVDDRMRKKRSKIMQEKMKSASGRQKFLSEVQSQATTEVANRKRSASIKLSWDERRKNFGGSGYRRR